MHLDILMLKLIMIKLVWICILTGTAVALNYTETEKYITSAGSLQESQFEKWNPCQDNEKCTQRRIHACATNTTHTQMSCGQTIWKEELFGCHVCDNYWESPNWSECKGNGCGDTVQMLNQTCANKAVNANCKKILTRFCHPKDICDGTWSTWSSEQDPCKDTCETNRARTFERTCKDKGRPSGNCDKTEAPFIQNKLQYCLKKSCPTTIESVPTTSTEESTTDTTQVLSASVTTWGEWSACNASCEEMHGSQRRQRECIYKNSAEVPPPSVCSSKKLIEVKRCKLQEVARCRPTTPSAATKLESTTITPNKRAFIVQKPNPDIITTTTDITTVSSRTDNTIDDGLSKQQYRILLIILGTTAGIIILIVLIYICCGKKKKKKRSRRNIGEISVVALQSHTGFMEGMEKYGFKKSMMPTDTVMTALQPATTGESTDMNRKIIHENQNSYHVYEEMRLPATEIHHPSNKSVSPMRRSLSHHEKRHNDAWSDINARRRSCVVEMPYAKPYKKAPPKPPRRSMPQLDDFTNAEIRDVPKVLYEAGASKLSFINSIPPPTTNRPMTSCDGGLATVVKTQNNNPMEQGSQTPQRGQIVYSKSAPTSPHHYQMGAIYATQMPFFNCMPSPLLMPYGNMPVIAPMQSQSQIIYMHSLLPVHQQKLTADSNIENVQESTPLHGTNTDKITRAKSNLLEKQRPFSLAFLPKISITDTNQTHLSPKYGTGQSSILEDYAEMKHLMASSPNLEENELFQRKSFKNLHGTQDFETAIDSEGRENLRAINDTTIPEDNEGYIIATV